LSLPLPHRSEELIGIVTRFPTRCTPSEEVTHCACPFVIDPRSPRLPHFPLPKSDFNMLPRAQPPTRLCSADKSVLLPSRCQLNQQPILPWALFPSKVSYTSLPSSFYRGRTDKLSLIGLGRTTAQRAGVRVASENPLVDSPELHSRKRVWQASPRSVRSANQQSKPCRPSWGL
jgi:hypothetical protein